MKITITGALGHIGSKLIRRLPELKSDLSIVMIDNLSTQRYASLFNLPKKGRYRFMEADIQEIDLEPLLKDSDCLIHLAAVTDATRSFEQTGLVERVNYDATKKVALACENTLTPMIYISTTSVYGSQEDIVDEECDPSDLKPQSPYAKSKLKGEFYLQELGERKGFAFTICRFGTIFGVSPGMRFHTVVNKFCWQAVMGVPLTVWQTAHNQKRPYLDLDDAINAISFILEKGLFDHRVYNVVTENRTIENLVDIIKKYVDDVRIRFVEAEIMNQLSYEVKNSRFSKIGFATCGSLEKGVRDTIGLLKTTQEQHRFFL